MHTLTAKYSLKVYNIISRFGRSPKIAVSTVKNKKQVLAEFLTPSDINDRTRRFLKWGDPISFKNYLENFIVAKQAPKVLSGNMCAILECNNVSLKAYDVWALRRVKRKFVVEFIKLKNMRSEKKYVLMGSAFNNQQILLCEEHHKLWYIFRRSCLTKSYVKKHIKITLESYACF